MSLLYRVLGKIYLDVAYAGVVFWDNYAAPLGATTGNPDFVANIAARAGTLFLQIVSGGAVLAIMWGATGMINSGGNEEGKENAKKVVIFAVGGLILAIISAGLINFVRDFTSDVSATN